MKLFINDKFINIIKAKEFEDDNGFDIIFDKEIDLESIKLHGHVLIVNGTTDALDKLLDLMEEKKLKKLQSITFITQEYKQVKKFIKSQFRIIKAAGGLVHKNDKLLMIFRLGKWDLPKGKLDKGEKPIEAAVREIEEECSVKVLPERKLCATWHTYVMEGRKILKKTYWYLMECQDDSQMKPQVEEDIEDIRWMTLEQTDKALENSYGSIIEVFKAYNKQKQSI